MAVTLWLVRHAKAVDQPPPGGRDGDRTLASRGEAEAAALAEFLESSTLHLPPTVLVSPAARTHATAATAFRSLPREALVTESRLYDATDDEVLSIVGEHAGLGSSIGVVGHNPTIGLLIDALAPPVDEAARRCPPGTLAVISLPAGDLGSIELGTGVLEVHRTP